MRLTCGIVLACLLGCSAASGQSLFIPDGQRAVDAAAAWSVGPSSHGLELLGAASLDGRLDVGFGVNRFWVDLGGFDSTFTEWTPFVRYLLFKEDDDGVPVSLAGTAQVFRQAYEGDDSGWYALAGATLFKRLPMSDVLALYPFAGFSLAWESYTFGGAPTERAVYLTRLFGVHGLITLTDGTWLRLSVDEHSFRRETYRAIRAAIVRRF